MLKKYKIVPFFILLLITLNFVSAQNSINIQMDFVNNIIVPTLVVFVLVFGILSTFRIFPKIVGGLLAAMFAGFLFYSKKITLLIDLLSGFGDVFSTFVFVGLFIIGMFLISRTGGVERLKKDYHKVRKMKRKQISKEMSRLERGIADVDSKIIKLKLQEDDLEIKFAANKNQKILRELDTLRKRKNYLVDVRDKLLEQKEFYKRAYREATT